MLKSILKGIFDRFCKPESAAEVPSPIAQSSEDKSRWVFEAHLKEYEKLRDEIVLRIGIQKSCIQYALTLTAAVAAFIGAMYSRGTGTFPWHNFLWLVLIAAFINALLLEFLIAYLLFQLNMVLRIHIYMQWVAAVALPTIMKRISTDSMFRWDRSTPGQPWQFVVRAFKEGWFQSGVLWSLVVLLVVGLLALFRNDCVSHETARAWTNAGFVAILVGVAIYLALTYRNLCRGVEEARRNVAEYNPRG